MNKFFEEINRAYAKEKEDKEKYGFYVHAVKEVYKDNYLISDWVNIHTHGLEEYGLTNISVVAPKEDSRLFYIIYTVGKMMKNGEYFDPKITHYIDDCNGNCIVRFRMLSTKCFGEDTIRLILPDPVTDKFYNEDDGESIYCLQYANIFDFLEEK